MKEGGFMSPSATLTNEHIEEWRALVPYFFSLLFASDSITALNTRGGITILEGAKRGRRLLYKRTKI
jgi:hypothetical protein